MSYALGLAVSVLAVCMGALAEAGQKVELRQYALPDPVLRCTAWTFVAPADWAKQGGVAWTGHYLPRLAYTTELSIRDAGREFRVFPTFMFLDIQGPIVAPGAALSRVLSPSDCVEKVVIPRCRPEANGVRVVWSEVLPQLTNQIVALARDSGQSSASIGAMRVRSGRVLVEYTAGSEEMEELFYCTIADAPGTVGARIWTNERTFSYRAKKGELQRSMAMLGVIGKSLKENPQWVAQRRQRLQQLASADSIPQTALGPMSIVDVTLPTARAQDEFLRDLDGGDAAPGAIPAAGQIGGNTWVLDTASYFERHRDYYLEVQAGVPGASDFYTTYPGRIAQPQSP